MLSRSIRFHDLTLQRKVSVGKWNFNSGGSSTESARTQAIQKILVRSTSRTPRWLKPGLRTSAVRSPIQAARRARHSAQENLNARSQRPLYGISETTRDGGAFTKVVSRK